MIILNSRSIQNCIAAFFVSCILSILFSSNYYISLLVIVLVPILFILFVQQRKFILLLVILTIFIEVTLQQIPIGEQSGSWLNFNGVLNLFILGYTLVLLIQRKLDILGASLSKAFLLYLGVVLFSLLVSPEWIVTLKSFVRISTGFCIYLLILNSFKDEEGLHTIYKVLLCISIIPICVGLYQIAAINKFNLSQALRIRGTFKNGQSYSMYLGIMASMIFAYVLTVRKGSFKKILGWTYFLLLLLNLLYSGTRIGWGTAIFSLFLYCFFIKRTRYILGLLFVVLVVSLPFWDHISSSFSGFFSTPFSSYFDNHVSNYGKVSSYESVSSLHIRVYVWKNMIKYLFDKASFLFGAGSGTWFGLISEKLHMPIASHSDYVEVLFGVGIVGFVFYLFFRIYQIIVMMKFSHALGTSANKNLVIFPVLAVFITLLVTSCTEVWQSYMGIYWTTWIIFGLAEGYYKVHLNKLSHGK